MEDRREGTTNYPERQKERRKDWRVADRYPIQIQTDRIYTDRIQDQILKALTGKALTGKALTWKDLTGKNLTWKDPIQKALVQKALTGKARRLSLRLSSPPDADVFETHRPQPRRIEQIFGIDDERFLQQALDAVEIKCAELRPTRAYNQSVHAFGG